MYSFSHKIDIFLFSNCIVHQYIIAVLKNISQNKCEKNVSRCMRKYKLFPQMTLLNQSPLLL